MHRNWVSTSVGTLRVPEVEEDVILLNRPNVYISTPTGYEVVDNYRAMHLFRMGKGLRYYTEGKN